jgi:outer membrane protein OmpA-like peptidoglycan-associated protein
MPDAHLDPGASAPKAAVCPLVCLEGEQIVLGRPIEFEADRDTVLPESLGVIAEVARLLAAHPEIQRVLVAGHTDMVASAEYSLDLSRRRATSVMQALIRNGVAPERLRSEGFGKTRPLEKGDDPEGRRKNRRIELTIERRAR